MKSLGFIPLGVMLLAGPIGAQGNPVPPFQIPAIREPHHFLKLDNKTHTITNTGTARFEAVEAVWK